MRHIHIDNIKGCKEHASQFREFHKFYQIRQNVPKECTKYSIVRFVTKAVNHGLNKFRPTWKRNQQQSQERSGRGSKLTTLL